MTVNPDARAMSMMSISITHSVCLVYKTVSTRRLFPGSTDARRAGQILAFINFIDVQSSALRGQKGSPSGRVMGYRFAEFAWLKRRGHRSGRCSRAHHHNAWLVSANCVRVSSAAGVPFSAICSMVSTSGSPSPSSHDESSYRNGVSTRTNMPAFSASQ